MIFLRPLFPKAFLLTIAAILLGGCDPGGTKVRGFILPKGDVNQGQATFVALGCSSCHTVFETEISQPDDAPFSVQLGGEFHQVKHYGDLLTSIVNPDHRVPPPYDEEVSADGRPVSPMPQVSQTMSVKQLIDVVEFLHGKYERVPNYAGKYYYYPG